MSAHDTARPPSCTLRPRGAHVTAAGAGPTLTGRGNKWCWCWCCCCRRCGASGGALPGLSLHAETSLTASSDMGREKAGPARGEGQLLSGDVQLLSGEGSGAGAGAAGAGGEARAPLLAGISDAHRRGTHAEGGGGGGGGGGGSGRGQCPGTARVDDGDTRRLLLWGFVFGLCGLAPFLRLFTSSSSSSSKSAVGTSTQVLGLHFLAWFLLGEGEGEVKVSSSSAALGECTPQSAASG